MSRTRLPESTVLLLGTGSLADTTARLVRDSGTIVEHRPTPPAVHDVHVGSAVYAAAVLATDRPAPSVERRLDDACRAAGVPWTAGLLLASHFRIGPTFIPGQMPCLDCFERRVRSQAPHLPSHDELLRFATSDEHPAWFTGELDALTTQVAALLAAEVVGLVTGWHRRSAYGLGTWWDGDVVFGALERHRFSRVSGCPRCDT